MEEDDLEDLSRDY